jgi:hypothetical protein
MGEQGFSDFDIPPKTTWRIPVDSNMEEREIP